ncbi:MAG: MMPL family transporter [Thermoleophilia bacterium]|nr:MMPL family transporter [Thermoleophilia bacterium]
MTNALNRLGRYAARRPWRVIGLWLVAAVLVIGASGAVGQQLEDTFGVPGRDSQKATDLLAAAGSDRGGLTAQVVASPRDGATFFGSAEARDALADLRGAVAGLPTVLAAGDPAAVLEADRGRAVGDRLISADGRVAVIRLQYPAMEELSTRDLDALEAALADAREGSPLRIEANGDLHAQFAEPAAGLGELVGVIAAVVILLIAFGSLIATGLPIGMALFGLAVGISLMPLIDHLIDIPGWAPQLAAMVGLGVGIDYALLLVTRHRENLARGLGIEESVGHAVATAGQAVVFAGGTVVIAILGLGVAGVPALTAAGIATSVIVLIMVIGSITLVPALLGLAGHWINRLGVPRRAAAAGDGGGRVGVRWTRWGRHVADHAVSYAVGATLVLLIMAAPVLALRLGNPDEGTLPQVRTERQAYDLVAGGFGPGANGPLLIAVDTSRDPGAVAPLARAIGADPGIASVSRPEIDARAGVATLVAYPTTSPQDTATIDTIDRLRAEVLPAALAGRAALAHVGGGTATMADVADQVSDRMPFFIGTVILLSVALLTLVFRSILVPLKAALLNLLSVGAAYGVLVMVFQWGWGKELIGLESTVPIISFVPMFMFAILFGLSMDYEVFLISRIREAYRATGDNHAAVIEGLAGTARVITSAALIMIAVFLGFVIGDDPTAKMFGLGLATAILVDVTIVRMVLLPATMSLLGDANWWMPRRLDRVLPSFDIEGAPAPAER